MRIPTRSLRTLVAALILGAGLCIVPASAPSPAAGIGPLPACRFDDILTFPRGYDVGPTTLVDTILSVGEDYRPPDLVPVSRAGVAGGGLVRRIAFDDLRAMASAAKANGTPLSNISTYRSYNTQVKLFNGYVNAYGYDEAVKFSARPGHSEHQLGLTIDFVSPGAGLSSSWEKTRTGGWMARHAWEYGWVMSYPKDRYETVCYTYEPWHYRYVGREVAAAIHESGLTIREYLWANYTMVDPVTGLPLPSATVTPSAPPSPSPAASPTAVPSTGPSATQVPAGSPAATDLPASPAGQWFGVDPPLVIAGALLALAAIGLVASLGFLRRSSRG